MEQRADEHKVFLGTLMPNVNKPMLMELFAQYGLVAVDIIVPSCAHGKHAFAFATFISREDTAYAAGVPNGMVDAKVSPWGIKALYGAL